MWAFEGLVRIITGAATPKNGFAHPLTELMDNPNESDDVGIFVAYASSSSSEDEEDKEEATFPDQDTARKALVDKCAHYVYSFFGREIHHDSDLYCNMSRIDNDHLLIPAHHPIIDMIVYHLRVTKELRYKPRDHFQVGETVFFIYHENVITESLNSLKRLFRDYYPHAQLIETWRDEEEEEEDEEEQVQVEPWPNLGEKTPDDISEKKDL